MRVHKNQKPLGRAGPGLHGFGLGSAALGPPRAAARTPGLAAPKHAQTILTRAGRRWRGPGASGRSKAPSPSPEGRSLTLELEPRGQLRVRPRAPSRATKGSRPRGPAIESKARRLLRPCAAEAGQTCRAAQRPATVRPPPGPAAARPASGRGPGAQAAWARRDGPGGRLGLEDGRS